MLINLDESKLFTVDPAVRFALIYEVHHNLWYELWRRKKLGYDLDGLCGYLLYKAKIRMEKDTMRRWLFRTEIYYKVREVMKMGVRSVYSEFFEELENELISELTRSMRSGAAIDSRTIV